MSLISMEFLLFLLAAAAGYYWIPKKGQWIWLLVFSYGFYLASGVKVLFFLLTTTVTTFGTGLFLEKEDLRLKRLLKPETGSVTAVTPEEKRTYKDKSKCRKRWILAGALVLNFGILAALKYCNFAIDNGNALFGTDYSHVNVLLPLGISFYTFQSMGYLIDVYRKKYAPEHNLFRFALFVSYFPQLLQGPIGRFDRLAHQFFEVHTFDLTRIERGLQLMLWGYFKKMVLADRAAVLVNQVFQNYEEYAGIPVMAAVLGYSIQLYADFSGGMDVVMGASECFGISLDQNFRQPYFARSISDFWHRWHITLGTWMKDYIFYPLSLSKGMNRLGKFTKKHCGKHVGRVLPVCISNLVVFFVVGVWHGAAWKYIAYGLYNGFLIAFSNLAAPLYQKALKALPIRTNGKSWILFQIVRTFLLVNIGWYFDMGLSFTAALIMMKRTVTGCSLSALTDGSLLNLGLSLADYAVLLLGSAVVFGVSLLKEHKVSVRESLAAKPLAVRWAVYLLLMASIPLLGQVTATGGGFIYAQF